MAFDRDGVWLQVASFKGNMKRLQVRLIAGVAALCAWWLTAAASAHHSHGNYGDNFIDLQGTVKEVHLLNPHSWVYLDVRGPNGQPQTWALEATNRIGLERVGVTADSLKPGEAIKARCHPLRDGSRGCLLGFVKTKDGIVRDWDGTKLPVPADF